MKSRKLLITALILLTIACVYGLVVTLQRTPKKVWHPETALVRADPPPLSDDRDVRSLITALDLSLRYYEKLPPTSTLRFGTDVVSVEEMRRSVAELREKVRLFGLTPGLFEYIRDHFVFYRTGADEALITGYFEARLRGSRVREGPYQYPLYMRPPDLVAKGPPGTTLSAGRITENGKIVPYYTRHEIDYEGALQGKGLELVWIDDPVDVSFLHIQGSGIVTLPDGKTLRVNYADRNGHAYRPIGRYLIEHGLVPREAVSMQRIRSYLAEHPEILEKMLSYDPSYVFFRIVDDGPIGCLGVPITPQRSVATDTSLFPRGAPGVIMTERPVFGTDGEVERWEPFTRLIVTQDTGGAIRGADRLDLFTGYGKEAEAIAGVMKQPGVFYFFRKKREGEI